MRLFMYAIYDTASKVYDRPWVARSDAEALRSFGDIANDPQHPIGKHPEHFSCFRIGLYDDNVGELIPESPVTCIGRAHELKRLVSAVENRFEVGNGSMEEPDTGVSAGGTV